MAVRDYVLVKYISGTSSHDIEVDTNQMLEDDSYAISDSLYFVACDIYRALYSFVDPKYTEDILFSLLERGGKYRLATYDVEGVLTIESIILFSDRKTDTYYYDLKGDFLSRQEYRIQHIDDEDLVYLVTEHIVNPEPDCDLIEKCYKPYFTDLFMARKYLSTSMKDYDYGKGKPSGGYKLFVTSVNKLSNSDWYKLNLKASVLIKKYHLNKEAYRYTQDIAQVVDDIYADAYDDLTIEEKADIDRNIFDLVRDYIPEEFIDDLETEMEHSDVSDVRSICDQAIMIALANASSADEFDDVYVALGSHAYRIGMLTDDIYAAHPDTGYIVATNYGELCWYESCYAINKWVGSRKSKYHGVFQPNESDVLPCFKDYHPELIVTQLPSQEEIDSYEKMYDEYKITTRSQHKEFLVLTNEDGDDVAIGTWYYEGLMSDNFKKETMFFKDYNKYFFTDDECKRLLNGEEIVVEHYMSKMGKEITIRGKLQDVSGAFDEDARVEFVRTDIDSTNRQKINSGMGITETGLPPSVAPSEGG